MRHRSSVLSYGICLFLFSSLRISEAADDWSYKDQENWGQVNEQCSSVEQSPINIQRETLVVNESLQLNYTNYDSSILAFKAMNNYHSIKLSYIGDVKSAPQVTGPAVDSQPYALEQFHFHWGSKRGIGSEHVIDGVPYSMEMHMVHYNSAKYKSVAKALEAKEGILVIAVFFKIHRQDNPHLAELTRLVRELKDKDLSYYINPEEPLVMGNFMPPQEHWNRFYHYQGSLTTPPCTQGVKWFILSEPIHIGLDQINEFRSVKDKHGSDVSDNYRATQNLGSRKVFTSFKAQHRHASSSAAPVWVPIKSIFSVLTYMTFWGLARFSLDFHVV